MKTLSALNSRTDRSAQAAAQLAVIVLKVRLGIGDKDDGQAKESRQDAPRTGGNSPAVSIFA